MCGRYTYFSSEEILGEYELGPKYDLQLALNMPDNFNVAPGSLMPVIIRGSQEHVVQFMQWGLVPAWSKTPNPSLKLINARAESLLEKNMWRNLIKSKRCIVPARGFYEWKSSEAGKQPFYITPKQGKVFSFAGLYDEWGDEHGNTIISYCIITTSPNKEMADVHKRMPAILDKDQEQIWLSATGFEEDMLDDLLGPSPDGSLNVVRVSQDVNNARNNKEDLIYPID